MKDVPDELSQRFVDSAMKFAADLDQPIMPCEAQQSRMTKRTALRHDFVEAYRAIKELEEWK